MTSATLALGEQESATADLVIVGIQAPPKEEEEDKEGDDEEEEEDSDKEPEPIVLTGAAKTLDEELQGALGDFLQEQAKTFKNGATVGAMTPALRVVGAASKRYIAMGLGAAAKEGAGDDAKKDWTGAAAGASLGKAVAEKCIAEKKISTCQVILPADVTSNSTIMQDFSTAFYQALYVDNRYRTGAKKKKVAEDLTKVSLMTDGDSSNVVDASVIEQGRLLARGIFLAKDIVNA